MQKAVLAAAGLAGVESIPPRSPKGVGALSNFIPMLEPEDFLAFEGGA